jgi:hypothetical protein
LADRHSSTSADAAPSALTSIPRIAAGGQLVVVLVEIETYAMSTFGGVGGGFVGGAAMLTAHVNADRKVRTPIDVFIEISPCR